MPAASSEIVHRVMSANKGRDTKVERLLRLALYKSGLRGYRVNWKIGTRHVDICYPRRRIVVYVHGCFWHDCPECSLEVPKSHSDYWKAKFAQNRLRDELARETLKADGWGVLEIWEHEIRTDLAGCVRRVGDALDHKKVSLGLTPTFIRS